MPDRSKMKCQTKRYTPKSRLNSNADDCVAKGELSLELRTPDTGRPPVLISLPVVMRGSAAGDRLFPLLLVGINMESITNNIKEEVGAPLKAPEEVSIDLQNINEPSTEQGQSPAIVTELENILLLTDIHKNDQSELERIPEACKLIEIESSTNQQECSESDVKRTSEVLEQKEVKEEIVAPIENMEQEETIEPLPGFVSSNSEGTVLVSNNQDGNMEYEETLEVLKQDETMMEDCKPDDQKDEQNECEAILDLPKDNEPKSSISETVTNEILENEEDGSKQDEPKSNGSEPESSQHGKDGESKGKSRYRLSGAGRKRYRWLLEKGHTPEEARLLASKPMTECRQISAKRGYLDDSLTDSINKRPRVAQENKNESTISKSLDKNTTQEHKKESTTPIALNKNAKKLYEHKTPFSSKPKMQPGPSRYNPTTKLPSALVNNDYAHPQNPKYAILAKDYPKTLLTKDQLRTIESSLLEKIVSKKGDVKLKFVGTSFQNGYLMITCGDKATSKWLKRTVPKLKPWEDASLIVLVKAQIPFSYTVVGLFTTGEKDSDEKILNFIGAQNEDLDVSKWKIEERTKTNRATEIVFSVDDKSVHALKRRGYKMNYKFGQIRIAKKTLLEKISANAALAKSLKRKRFRQPPSLKNVHEDRRVARYDSPLGYMRDESQYMRDESRYMRDSSGYMRDSSGYMRDSSGYMRDSSGYMRDDERDVSQYSLFTAKQIGHTSRANPSIFDHRL